MELLKDKKYIGSLLLEVCLLLVYIFKPEFTLGIIGTKGNQINILGLLLFYSFHIFLGSTRKSIVKDRKDLKNINIAIEVLILLLGLFAVYRLQVSLDIGI